jgi:hypothetical protein
MQIAPDDTAPTSGDGPAFALFVENCVPKVGITCYDWDAGIPSGPQFDDVAGTEPIPTGQWGAPRRTARTTNPADRCLHRGHPGGTG